MELVHFFLRIFLAYLGAIGAYMGCVVLWRLHKDGRKAMASFQLKPADGIEDFKILLAAEGLMIIGFIFYFIGGVTEITLFLNIGRAYAVIFSMFVILVSYRWWVRF